MEFAYPSRRRDCLGKPPAAPEDTQESGVHQNQRVGVQELTVGLLMAFYRLWEGTSGLRPQSTA